MMRRRRRTVSTFPSFKPSYDQLIAIYGFHQGYPGNWYIIWKFDYIKAIYRLHQGYQGNWCFWENDHIIDIYRLHQGYPGNLHNFWKLGNIIPTYRLHQGYQGSWSSFWENDHIIAIYWLHLGYKICIMTFYYTKDTWVTDVHFGSFPTSTIISFPDFEWSISWTSSFNQLLFEPVIL